MSAICKDCKVEYHAFSKMVIIHDKLWLKVANKKDHLCDKCIEKRLGRKLTSDDLKMSNEANIFDGSNRILVNMFWADKNGIIY